MIPIEVNAMRVFSILLCVVLLFCLTGCTASEAPIPETLPPETTANTLAVIEETQPPVTLPPDPIEEILEDMTIEERVGQLFLARCQDATAVKDVAEYHLGGFVLFASDFNRQTPDTLREKLQGYQAAAEIPLLIAVDEEGGTVTRISRYSAFREVPFPSPRSAMKNWGMDGVMTVEEEKCRLLSSLNINVNLGPVCDISTDPTAFMYARSLGQDAFVTSDFVSQTVAIMADYQIGSVLNHFPGYGNNADTHTGIAQDGRSLEELENADLLPFAAGIEAGCDAILVSHTIVGAMDDTLPASLSPAVHNYLREAMGFQGVILTDDLVMQAITDTYGAGEAAVLAVLAGNDLLCATDYATQYEAVHAAVLEGRIGFDTLNNAVRHVLHWKMVLGLLQ